MPVNENLVGYLLNALEDDERQAVERGLAVDPSIRQRLELLREALEPLEADAVPPEPPGDLWQRTLARIEQEVPPVLKLRRPTASDPAPRAWWRRSDVLVAASILLAVLSLVPSGLNSLRDYRDRLRCQDNLRVFHQALMAYCDGHGDNLPKVEAEPPRNFAAVFVPILRDAGALDARQLSPEVRLSCSTENRSPRGTAPLADLQDLNRLSPEERDRQARLLSGSYAYVLGYRDETGQLQGVRREPGTDRLPVLADCPPFRPVTFGAPLGNSLNHAGAGQNVLYLGGNVSFCTLRTVGVEGDDIYLNRQNRVEAGLGRWDTVLGAGPARPLSVLEE
jgi:hypothetical protein